MTFVAASSPAVQINRDGKEGCPNPDRHVSERSGGARRVACSAADMVAIGGHSPAHRARRERRGCAWIVALTLLLCGPVPAYAHSEIDDLERVHWQVNTLGIRDCKANAFEALRRLEDYGIGSDRARMVVVIDETGAYHAIAVIDGTYALDSRQRDVVTVEHLRAQGYQISSLVDHPSSQIAISHR